MKTRADRRAITITLTDQDDGGLIQARVGDTFEIDLPEGAAAGYQWSVDEVDASSVTVGEVTTEYSGQPIGSGGRARVQVTVRNAGRSTVRLKYWRPWEGADGVRRRFTVDVDAVPD